MLFISLQMITIQHPCTAPSHQSACQQTLGSSPLTQ